MPTTMKQLAIVQFFTRFALPFMWQFDGLTVARRDVFGAVDDHSDLFKQGTEWAACASASYNLVCFLVAFGIPPLAAKIGRKGVHMICLTCGGLGLISTYFAGNPYFLWDRNHRRRHCLGLRSFRCPDAILAGAIKPGKEWAFTWVFSICSSVIPQVVQSFLTPQIYKSILGNNPLNAVILGGITPSRQSPYWL